MKKQTIDPVAKDKKIIFLNVRNTSGQNINIESKLISILQSKGYVIVDDPEQATFILSINILYCNKKQENNAAVGATLGIGLGVGVAAYNSNSMTAAVLTTGAIGLVSGLIGKLTEDIIYQMQVDINIKQRAKAKVLSTALATVGQANVVDGKKVVL